MPVEQREEALKGWTRARWLIPVKIAFAIIKTICLNVFYTTVRTC
jgi:long-chain-alcohol oxidase